VKEIQDYYKDDEIDLVDILVVLIKRKWIVIGLVLVAFVLSLLYVLFFSKNSYKMHINMHTQQEYYIANNNLLGTTDAQVNALFSSLKKDLQTRSYKSNNDEKREYYYKYNITIGKSEIGNKIIDIQLTGQKEKIIDVVEYIYNMYDKFENNINNKNIKLLEISEDTINDNLSQKQDLLVNLSYFLNPDNVSKLPQGSETAVLYTINKLKHDIVEIEKIKELNKTVELIPGNFMIINSTNSSKQEISISKDDLSNIEYYVEPEKSRKRQFLPVIVAVFISFFIGIFLVYMVEFFNRDDVRKRLKDIKNK